MEEQQMKLAFLYAGQGSQYVGMGQSLYQDHPTFRPALDSTAAGFDLKALCFEGAAEQLAQTRYTQPCMAAFAAGVTDLLYEAGIRPQITAGLSLGEYSALYAAGVLDKDGLIGLTAFRGEAMERAAQGLSCGMTAVLGLEREVLAAVCREASAVGVVEISNYNCPGQLVIGGEAAAVQRAGELALAAGARRCLPLNVSGPFHTSLMEPAGEALSGRLAEMTLGRLTMPVVFNATALPLHPGQEEKIPELLVRQVHSSIFFEDSVRYLEAQGIDTVVEIGPGKVLSGFARKTAPALRTLTVEDTESLKAAVTYLKGAGYET
jgi:[acyl-carrier-protein] S-malonyltransferase